MGVFTLRSALGASALRTATPDYFAPRIFAAGAWHILFDGTDDTARDDLTTLRVTDSGPGAASRLSVQHFDPTRAFTIPARAYTEVVDATGTLIWTGRVISRSFAPISPAGFTIDVEASDLQPDADATYIGSDATPAGWDDRAVVQYLVSRYAYTGLRAPDLLVNVTNTSMPALTFTVATLAKALTQVADAAGANRTWWVDYLSRINYGYTSAFVAPYAISDTPDGTTSIAAETLTHESDESGILNAVWVVGPTDPITNLPVAADWVLDVDSITLYGRRETTLQNDDATDAAKIALYGSAYLAKVSQPVIRGSFTVTNKDGWRSGQAVSITNAALNLGTPTGSGSAPVRLLLEAGTYGYLLQDSSGVLLTEGVSGDLLLESGDDYLLEDGLGGLDLGSGGPGSGGGTFDPLTFDPATFDTGTVTPPGWTFQISQVEMDFLDGTGKRHYTVSYGELPKSLVRLLAAN